MRAAQIGRVKGKSLADDGRVRLTLVLFEFYLTVRKALTNSIPLSGGAADVSGFACSYRDAAIPFGREETDDVVRYTKVLRTTTTIRSLPSPFALSSTYLVYPTRNAIPLPHPLSLSLSLPPFLLFWRLCSVLRGKLLRGASLFWIPYFTDSDHPLSCIPRYLPFYPFSLLSPHPSFRRSLRSALLLLSPVQSLLSLHVVPSHPS